MFGLYAEVTAERRCPCASTTTRARRTSRSATSSTRGVARCPACKPSRLPGPRRWRPRGSRAARAPEQAASGSSGDCRGAAALAGAPTVVQRDRRAVAGGRARHRPRRTRGRHKQAIEASDQLSGFWELFETYGSLRVVAAAAAELGVTQEVDLPRPLRPLDPAAHHRLEHVLASLGLEPEGTRPCTP